MMNMINIYTKINHRYIDIIGTFWEIYPTGYTRVIKTRPLHHGLVKTRPLHHGLVKTRPLHHGLVKTRPLHAV